MTSLPPALKNRILLGTSALALCVNALHWLFVATRLSVRDMTLPAHYNIYFGIDLVGPWWYAFLLPVAGSSIVVVNIALAFLLHKKKAIATYYGFFGALLSCGILFLASALILTNV